MEDLINIYKIKDKLIICVLLINIRYYQACQLFSFLGIRLSLWISCLTKGLSRDSGSEFASHQSSAEKKLALGTKSEIFWERWHHLELSLSDMSLTTSILLYVHMDSAMLALLLLKTLRLLRVIKRIELNWLQRKIDYIINLLDYSDITCMVVD